MTDLKISVVGTSNLNDVLLRTCDATAPLADEPFVAIAQTIAQPYCETIDRLLHD